jgi:hypothetical protein
MTLKRPRSPHTAETCGLIQATILWLIALRRESEDDFSVTKFLRGGLVVKPPALIFALAALLLVPPT